MAKRIRTRELLPFAEELPTTTPSTTAETLSRSDRARVGDILYVVYDTSYNSRRLGVAFSKDLARLTIVGLYVVLSTRQKEQCHRPNNT